jgi:hypothetical protein
MGLFLIDPFLFEINKGWMLHYNVFFYDTLPSPVSLIIRKQSKLFTCIGHLLSDLYLL